MEKGTQLYVMVTGEKDVQQELEQALLRKDQVTVGCSTVVNCIPCRRLSCSSGRDARLRRVNSIKVTRCQRLGPRTDQLVLETTPALRFNPTTFGLAPSTDKN
jgi:hypothetical protein